MSNVVPRLSKDRDEILLKFKELIDKADNILKLASSSDDGSSVLGELLSELRVSSINVLSRLAADGTGSIYIDELKQMPSDGYNVSSFKGVLQAARTDYAQGFMVDHKLLISAEVFSDLLVQAEVLLVHDYKDAAAVIIRAVLEDGIRKLCEAHKIEAGKRDTIQQLNEKLYKEKAYSALQHKEIVAKAEIGNCAAHGRFDQYKKEDVEAFLEFVLRFLAQYLK